MRSTTILFSIVASFAATVPTMATAQAPSGMLNKSVTISWGESAQQKLPDGRIITEQITRQRIAYVSSAGRVFVKTANRGSGGGSSSAEVVPGSSNTSLNFRGNTMVGHAIFAGFARQVVVSFDPAYSSCSVTVTYGKSGGSRTWKSFDGQRTIELLGLSVGATTCSISSGNALAG